MTSARRLRAYDCIRSMMSEVPAGFEEEMMSSKKRSITAATADKPPCKKARLDMNTTATETSTFFGDLYQTSTAAATRDELELYMECPDVSDDVHF